MKTFQNNKNTLLRLAIAALTAIVTLAPARLCAWEKSNLSAGVDCEPASLTTSVGARTMSVMSMAGMSSVTGDAVNVTLTDPKSLYDKKGPGVRASAMQNSQASDMEVMQISGQSSPIAAMSASSSSAELESIAASLEYNAGRIVDWVVNYIDYEAYNGLKRGARLTALERAGNSFDTAALTVELLRIAGFPASYVYVNRTAHINELSNWLNVAPDQALNFLIDSGGDYQARPGSFNQNAPVVWPLVNNEVLFPHVWVKVIIDGEAYYVDPSFKPYSYGAQANWPELSGYSAQEVFDSAGGSDTYTSANGTSIPTYIGSKTGRNNMRAKLAAYTSALVRNIANDATHHSRSGREVMGGRWLNRSSHFGDGLAVVLAEWTGDIPSTYHTKFEVKIGGLTREFTTASLGGAKLSIDFESTNGRARLYVDDVLYATEPSASGTTAAINLKYSYTSGLHGHSMPAAPIFRQGHYVITHGFNNCLYRLKDRMRILGDMLDQNKSTTSREVLSENLYILGLQYLNELNGINEISSATLPANTVVQHHAGVVGQHQAPYVDLPICLANIGLRTSVSDPAEVIYKAFMTGMYWGSMLEHSIIEQALVTNANPQNAYLEKGVSTMKFIQHYVDCGEPIYLARNLTEWNKLKSATSMFIGYNQAPGIIAEGDAVFASNNNSGGMLLPKNYSQSYGSYSGMGYVSMRKPASGPGATMGLTGVLGILNGGASTMLSDLSKTSFNSIINTGVSSNFSAIYNDASSSGSIGQWMLGDPVNASSGALYMEATDLALGGKMPYGLSFTRYHSTGLRQSDPTGLGKSWTHNYNIRLNFQHAGTLDLSRASTAEVAPFIIATRAIYDIYSSSSSSIARHWVVPALVTCWAGDQLINTRALMQMGERSYEFVKLPDGTFAPPAGVAATLTKNGTNHVVKFRKGQEVTFREKDGRFTSITDRNTQGQTARSLTATYSKTPSDWDDETARLAKVTDAYGRTLSFAYSNNQLTQVTDSAGRFTKYSTTVSAFTYTDPENKVVTYNKDARNRITSIVDAKGRTTIASFYDNYDRVVTQWNQNDSSKIWTYDYAPGTTLYKDPLGNYNIYYFDTRGRKVLEYDQLGNRTEWAYDGVDRLVAIATPQRNAAYNNGALEETWYSYDKNHELIAVTDPAGRITTMEPSDDTSTTPSYQTSPGGLEVETEYYANIHLPSKVTKTGGIVETYAYDTYGRLTQHHPSAYGANQYVNYAYTPATGTPTQVTATFPGGGTQVTKYDAIGNVTETIDRAGVKTTYTYNKRRQVTQTVVWSGAAAVQTSQIFYDDAGDVTYTIGPRNNRVDYSYNAEGKLDWVTDAMGNTVINTYDLRNLLKTTTDPLGFQTVNTYDAAQRVVAVTNALGHTAGVTYDNVGLQVSATTVLGHVTRSEYDDARFLVTKTTDALGYDITFTYDEDGRQLTMTNRRGNTYTTSYDDVLRKVLTRTPEGRETTVFANTRGLMDTTFRPSDKMVKNLTFDNEGRVLTQAVYADDHTTVLVSSTMSYDAAGRLHQIKENGKTTTRTYDALGRLASYSDGEGNLISYGYDEANNLTTLTYPGSKTVTYTYDANNRLETVKDWNDRTTTYTYDAAGRLKETLRANGTVRKQVYDAIGQLRFIEERSAADVLLWMRTLQYDADGRITKTHTWPSSTASNYTALNAADSAFYDADNRITQWNLGAGGSVDTTFDDDGNMVTGPAVLNPTGSAVNYQYDAQNRLTGVGGRTVYRYNPDGHRVEADGVGYVVDPNGRLSRILMRKQGGNITYYIWGAGLVYEINGTATTSYHADHLGSTTLLTNDAGNATGDYYEYDSHGNPTYAVGSNQTPFRWHGTLGVTTENNGLIHMRARFYHPRIMRFMNQDPIGFQGGLNMFAFVNGDPVSGVDPAGLCREGVISSGISQPFGNRPFDPENLQRQALNDIANWFDAHPYAGYTSTPKAGEATFRDPYEDRFKWYSSIKFESTMTNYLLRAAIITNYTAISGNNPSPSPSTDGSTPPMIYKNQATRGQYVYSELTISKNYNRVNNGMAVLDGVNAALGGLQSASSFMNKFEFMYYKNEYHVIDLGTSRILDPKIANQVLVENMKARNVDLPERLQKKNP